MPLQLMSAELAISSFSSFSFLLNFSLSSTQHRASLVEVPCCDLPSQLAIGTPNSWLVRSFCVPEAPSTCWMLAFFTLLPVYHLCWTAVFIFSPLVLPKMPGTHMCACYIIGSSLNYEVQDLGGCIRQKEEMATQCLLRCINEKEKKIFFLKWRA